MSCLKYIKTEPVNFDCAQVHGLRIHDDSAFYKMDRTIFYDAKNATAIAPGPTCVPIVAPIELTGRLSAFPFHSFSLS